MRALVVGFLSAATLLIAIPAWAQPPVVPLCGQPAAPCTYSNGLATYNQSYNQLAVTPGASPLVPPVGFPTTALPKALFNGNGATECNITVQSAASGASTVTFSNVQPGEILPISPAYVTASTCANLIALY